MTSGMIITGFLRFTGYIYIYIIYAYIYIIYFCSECDSSHMQKLYCHWLS